MEGRQKKKKKVSSCIIYHFLLSPSPDLNFSLYTQSWGKVSPAAKKVTTILLSVCGCTMLLHMEIIPSN